MKSTKIQPQNGKVKYVYDYPENREVSKTFSYMDKLLISQKTGFSLNYIWYWCKGKRKNRRIEELARKIMRLNKAKLCKLNN